MREKSTRHLRCSPKEQTRVNGDKRTRTKTIHANTRWGTEQGKAEKIHGAVEQIFDASSKNAGLARTRYIGRRMQKTPQTEEDAAEVSSGAANGWGARNERIARELRAAR